MAIPKQAIAQEQEADAALAAMQKAHDAKPDDSAQPAAVVEPVVEPVVPVEPVVEPTPEPPPPVVAPVAEPQPANDDLQRKLDELNRQLEFERHRNASLNGRIESQLKPLNEELRQMRETMAAIQNGMPKTPERPDYLRQVKDDELEDADPKVLDFQARVARGVAEAAIERAEARRRAEAQPKIDATPPPKAGVPAFDIWAEVERVYPGARKMNDEKQPNWMNFLNADSGYMLAVGQKAIDEGDVGTLINIVGASRNWKPVVPPPPQPRIAVRTASVPITAGNPAPEKVFTKKRQDELLARFHKDPRLKSDKAFMAELEQYEIAGLEGRLRVA